MTLGEHVFLYCERGTSDALLAEPINAASNGAFLLAALARARASPAPPARSNAAPTIIS